MDSLPFSNNPMDSNFNEKNIDTTGFDSSSIDYSESRFFNNYDQAVISILGIDLYFDDILILCILLSLYLEGVKDEMLFISLILLLLT